MCVEAREGPFDDVLVAAVDADGVPLLEDRPTRRTLGRMPHLR